MGAEAANRPNPVPTRKFLRFMLLYLFVNYLFTIEIPIVVAHIDDTFCANHAVYAAYGERTIKIVWGIGIEVVNLNLSRAMDILSIAQI